MKKNTERVLITGASSGIGLELAREFARHGHPLILTATVEAELAGVARESFLAKLAESYYTGVKPEEPLREPREIAASRALEN